MRSYLITAAVVALSSVPNAARAAAIVVQPGVQITVGGAASKPAFVVGRPATGSPNSCWLSGKTVVGEVKLEQGKCEYGGVLVFSKGHAPLWSAVAGPSKTVALGGVPKKIVLNVHFVGPANRAKAASKKFNTWLNAANAVFGVSNPLGLTLVNPGMTTHTVDRTAGNDDYGKSVGQGCATSGAKRILAPYYNPNLLTIYVVPDVFDEGNAVKGVRCGATPNLIYVSLDEASHETLAHEIAHALDLEHIADADWANDHRNLMIDGEDVDKTYHYKRLTAGQAVQSIFGKASWLNAAAADIKPPMPNAATLQCPSRCPSDILPW